MLDMDLAMSKIDECAKREADAEQNRLADAFEATVTAIVNSVAAASEELGQTARAMSATADQTQEKSSTVAAAAEEATVTAQSVAGAAQQLTSAISEISERAGEAAQSSGAASEQARSTGETMGKLRDAAQKIGEIVTLIEAVAEQTNLSGPQRHHRSGTRGRSRQGLCGGGQRGEIPRQPDRQGHRANLNPDQQCSKRGRRRRHRDRGSLQLHRRCE
jgi:hypothetical protein